MNTKRLLRLVGVISFYALLLAFSFFHLENLEIEQIWPVKADLRWLTVAGVIEVLNRFLFAASWVILVRSVASVDRPKLLKLFRLFATAWLARYLPGGATWLFVRVLGGSQTGVSRLKLVATTLVEAILQVVVLVVIALVAIVFTPELDVLKNGRWVLAVASVLIGTIFLQPRIFRKALEGVARLTGQRHSYIIPVVGSCELARASLLYAATTFVSAAGLYLLSVGVDENLFDEWALILAISAVAGAMSRLAFFAPAGLGVREVIFILGLGAVTTPEAALTIAILHRLLGILSDATFFGILQIQRIWSP